MIYDNTDEFLYALLSTCYTPILCKYFICPYIFLSAYEIEVYDNRVGHFCEFLISYSTRPDRMWVLETRKLPEKYSKT